VSGRGIVLVAAGGSALALAVAFVAQWGFGLAPCQMCIWQRWPHAAAIALGGAALLRGGMGWRLAGAAAALTAAGLGAWHAGFERGWLPGPTGCTDTGGIGGVSVDALLDPGVAMAVPVPCDAVAAAFLGISMAGWNAIFSLVLALVWIAAARAERRR
jgi:disulfide bond formation protein DsbB